MKKILLVDDSTAIRNILKTALYGDYEILEACDGKEALEVLNKESIDFCLFDVNMPRMDGITLVRELRKIPKYEKTPVVMLTTESKDEKKQEGKKAGANGWVVKPCDPEKLLNLIKKLV
jgi:two-component system chemotaxis response regulator CheY